MRQYKHSVASKIPFLCDAKRIAIKFTGYHTIVFYIAQWKYQIELVAQRRTITVF